MAVVSMSYLLESGVHFGHHTKKWNPKMKEYIYTSRDGIYIIDLQKTKEAIEEAYVAMNQIAANGGKVLFVGTRKQAQEAIKTEAERSNSFFVTERWLGGTLTNFKTIRARIKRMEEIEKMEEDGTFSLLPKKEVFGLKKEHDKLETLLGGIREMHKLPSALFVVDPSKEEIAIKEANILKIPVFGIVDTNCDPDRVDYVIPANDDAIRAVKLITSVMANAINAANGGNIVEFGDTSVEDDVEEIMRKALENIKKREERPRRNNFRSNNNRGNYSNNRSNNNNRGNYNNDRSNNNDRPNNSNNRYSNNVTKEEIKVEAKPEVKAEVKKEVKTESFDLSKKTVAELREIAKTKNIAGVSTMKKSELIDALK